MVDGIPTCMNLYECVGICMFSCLSLMMVLTLELVDCLVLIVLPMVELS